MRDSREFADPPDLRAAAHMCGALRSPNVASILAGLIPLSAGWWSQGLVAAIVIALIGLCIASKTNDLFKMSAFAAVVFCLASGLSFVPGIASGAGILTLGGIVTLGGSFVFVVGLQDKDVDFTRFGLTMLGGFVTAGAILAADAVVKAFG